MEGLKKIRNILGFIMFAGVFVHLLYYGFEPPAKEKIPFIGGISTIIVLLINFIWEGWTKKEKTVRRRVLKWRLLLVSPFILFLFWGLHMALTCHRYPICIAAAQTDQGVKQLMQILQEGDYKLVTNKDIGVKTVRSEQEAKQLITNHNVYGVIWKERGKDHLFRITLKIPEGSNPQDNPRYEEPSLITTGLPLVFDINSKDPILIQEFLNSLLEYQLAIHDDDGSLEELEKALIDQIDEYPYALEFRFLYGCLLMKIRPNQAKSKWNDLIYVGLTKKTLSTLERLLMAAAHNNIAKILLDERMSKGPNPSIVAPLEPVKKHLYQAQQFEVACCPIQQLYLNLCYLNILQNEKALAQKYAERAFEIDDTHPAFDSLFDKIKMLPPTVSL